MTRKEITDWSNSIKQSPALLRKSLVLRPMFELMDHPSIHEAIVRRSNFTSDGVTKEKDPKKITQKIKRLKKSLLRKRKLLENHLRWFMVKSEALGTALDRSTAARVKSEHQLKVMARTVQDWVDTVLQEKENKDNEHHNNVDDIIRGM